MTGSKKNRDLFNRDWLAFPFKKSGIHRYSMKEVGLIQVGVERT